MLCYSDCTEFMLCYSDYTWSLCLVIQRLYLEFMFCYSPIVPGVYGFFTHRLYLEFMLCYSDCTWSLCFVTQIVPSLCFVTHRLYLEFIFCYSPIIPGVYALLLRLHRVYVLLLTDCTWSLCFVTQIVPRVYAFLLRLYLEFLFYY